MASVSWTNQILIGIKMKFTIKWLREHLDFGHNYRDLIDKLNSLGLEVETFHNPYENLKQFKIVEITNFKKHPDADRLNLCEVSDGRVQLQIVCGANNVRSGLKTVLAPVGSYLPIKDENDNLIKIKKSKIRGIESIGMLCSEYELGLSNQSEGIIDLASSYKIGKYFSDYADEEKIVLEIGITPNRVDCASVMGVARDLHASGFGKFRQKKFKHINQKFDSKIGITNLIKDSDCPEFSLRHIKNVKNVSSPDWLVKRFNACNIKVISSLVDVTNFSTIDSCRPLHVFDFDKITGNITVRYSESGEKFIGLDGEEYILDKGMIVICDDSGVISLAGILGGLSTACDNETKQILIESAYFNPERIAATGRKLKIISDARYRFERGIDPLSTRNGLNFATNMINEICGGEVGSTIFDGTYEKDRKEIKIDNLFVEKLLGKKFSLEFIEDKLLKIGCKMTLNNNEFLVTPPSWRGDISIAEDLVEEVARLYGYENIEDQQIFFSDKGKKIVTKDPQIFKKKVGRFLVSKGLTEIISWSFVDEKYERIMQTKTPIKISNPISEDLSCLRSNLVINLLLTLNNNLKRGFKNLNFFEIGPAFYGDKPGEQCVQVCGVRHGRRNDKDWFGKPRFPDIYDAKSDLLGVLNIFKIYEDNLIIDQNVECYFHPRRSGTFYLGKNKIGSFGIIHPKILDEFNLKSDVSIFNVNFSNILDFFKTKKNVLKSYIKPLFQSSIRDFSFIVEKKILASQIVSSIKKSNNKLIKSIRVFDFYEGKEIGENKKAIALEVLLQSDEKTLSENEIDQVSRSIIENVEKKCNGKLR